MIRRLSHYLTALATLLLLAGAYLATVDRWLRSPPVEPIPERVATVELRGDDALADLFPETAWQRGRCKRLKTADGMLLFQNWEQTSRHEWRLWPITVIVGRGIDPERSQSPLIVDSSEGARIEFAESLDIMSGGAPPIRGGEIRGEVSIRRLAPSPDRVARQSQSKRNVAERFEILTSNVFIDDRKIWTTQPIEMWIGDLHARGEDLTLEFAAAASRVRGSPDPVSILQRMELIYLHELTMPLHSAAGDSMTGNSMTGGQVALQCGGRVQYDFTRHRLRLLESVTLTRQLPGLAPDRFVCEELEVELLDPMDRTRPRAEAIDWLASIHASGRPAVADLPSIGCAFSADSIEVNFPHGELRASGGEGVGLRYGGIRARFGGLVYSFDPKHPRRLGMIDARGAGQVFSDDLDLPLREASWQDGLLVRNDSGGDTLGPGDVLKFWIDGEVTVGLVDGGSFRADAIEGDLRVAGSGGRPGTSAAGSGPDNRGTTGQLLPERFTANGNVRLQSSAIDAETELLQLFFEHLPASGEAPERSGGEGQPDGLRQWVGQPSDERPTTEPVAAPRPVIRGSLIAAKLSLRESELVGRDLTVRGGVELTHLMNAGGQSLQARLTGEELRWKEGRGEDVIYLRSLEGNTARLDLGDGYFVGPSIQVLPAANLVEMHDAGEFRMPTAVLPSGLGGESESSGSGIRWTYPPRCRWQEAMTFDGQTARLLGGVRVDASLVRGDEPWDVLLTGQSLQLHLQQNVKLRDASSLRRAAVQQIRMTASENQPVLVEAFRRAADGALEARHLLHATELTFLPTGQGRLVGTGPGWYRAWLRRSLWAASGQTDGETASANETSPAERLMTGVHLIFHEALIGDLQAGTVEFRRGVRAGTRTVASWEETFDAAKMDAIAIDESTIDCDRLRLQIDPTARGPEVGMPKPSGRPTAWEMIADGGVVFRTRNPQGLYEGAASQATYASAKDRFTVLAAADRAAVFRRTPPSGQPPTTVEFRSLVLRPRDMSIEDMQLQGVTYGGLGGSHLR